MRAKGIKKELNTLDEADFVRDVENRDYHHVFTRHKCNPFGVYHVIPAKSCVLPPTAHNERHFDEHVRYHSVR